MDDLNVNDVTKSSKSTDQLSSTNHIQKEREKRMRLEKVGHYKIGQTLGRGNFATVRVAFHEITNTKVAVKIVDQQCLNSENMAKIEREIEILQLLSHPYIIKLYEIIRTDRYLYIITEYVANGELFDMLMDKGRQTENESRRLFQQIASAVLYCHAKGIVHRDLKAENLLIDRKGNIKLIDFGFSNYQISGQLLSTWCGSPPYAAPELLLAQAYDGRTSDVWSLGIILYILVTAGFPFPGESVDNLKRAVLGNHLKIPFWVSVECSDLIRRMLTVSPAKRCTMQNVVQHKWFTNVLPEDIKNLINSRLPNKYSTATMLKHGQLGNQLTTSAYTQNYRQSGQLDPTVLVYMQQHTKWTEEQIYENVLSGNYSSSIFATYKLLLAKLEEFKSNEINRSGANMSLRLDSEQNRRGSRGSILLGKAYVEPDGSTTTIPAHHLAKLSLTTNLDDESDESSTSDLCETTSTSSKIQQKYLSSHTQKMQQKEQNQQNCYKVKRRRGIQALQDRQQNLRETIENNSNRRHTLCAAASGTTPLNPLLSAAAQQFSVDTRAWANAAAAAAMFATQLHRQNNPQQQRILKQSEINQQQNLQQTALNLLSLQNFPFDYARAIHTPNQERRASANEALLSLNNYAHLLAACSTMGISSVTSGINDYTNNTVCLGIEDTENSSSPTCATIPKHESIEEEGKNYLNQQGTIKRNTVHLGATYGASSRRGGPYSKQNSIAVNSNVGCSFLKERRSSWTSSATSTINALNISAQQQAQLEKLYRQSISSPCSTGNNLVNDVTPATATGINTTTSNKFYPSESITGVQQLQLEFQKLCATTKDFKQLHGIPRRSNSYLPISSSYNVIYSLLDIQTTTPTISITNENNESLTSPLPAYSPSSLLSSTSANEPRPATVIGFSSACSSSINSGSSAVSSVVGSGISGSKSAQQMNLSPSKTMSKYIYVPVSPVVALKRLDRFVKTNVASGMRYETQSTISEDNSEAESMRIRVTPDDGHTILEMILFPMPQSPNISKAKFTMINGNLDNYSLLREKLLNAFNEVY